MTTLDILEIGHPLLREVASPISLEQLRSPEIQLFIDNLVETMHAANGAGLAATQVGAPIRICAIEVNKNPRYPYKPDIPLTILVNPVLTPIGDETFENYEGCLSVPNLRGKVTRYGRLRVTAWDRQGETIEQTVTGFTAGTYQHEVDHLDGSLFLDRVSDSSTLATWDQYEKHHKASFIKDAQEIISRFS